MRIAFVSTLTSATWGGSEILWSMAARRLLEGGAHVLFGPHVAVPGKFQGLDPDRARVMDGQYSRSTVARLRARLDRAHALEHLDRRFAAVADFRPDLVVLALDFHLHGEPWMAWCRQRGLPYAIIVQSVSETHWPAEAEGARLREGYRAARRVFFVSRSNREITEDQILTALTNAEEVCNPYTVAFGDDPRWPADEPLSLAVVGRFYFPAKGQDLLFPIFASDRWRARGVRVNFFGSGPHEYLLHGLIQKYGLGETMAVRGFASDVGRIWEENHALLLPSRHEGTPLVAIEAMHCHRPCILTRVGGAPEIIEEGRNGFLAEAPTVPLLERALENFHAARGGLHALGARARAFARERFPADPAEDLAGRIRSLVT